MPISALLAALLLAGVASAEDAPEIHTMTVSGLTAGCRKRGLSALECERFRAGYITGAYEALLAAQTLLKTWTPEEQANAEQLIQCMRSQDREQLFAAYQTFEPRIEVANESAIVLLTRLAEKGCGERGYSSTSGSSASTNWKQPATASLVLRGRFAGIVFAPPA